MSQVKYVSDEEYRTVMEQALPLANQLVSLMIGFDESVALVAMGMVIKGNCVTADGDLDTYLRVVEVAARATRPEGILKAQ